MGGHDILASAEVNLLQHLFVPYILKWHKKVSALQATLYHSYSPLNSGSKNEGM